MLPFTKKFATAHPGANTTLSVITSLVLVVGAIVFIQTRPQPARDPLWAACFFVLAAAYLGATVVAVRRRTLATIGRGRARRQLKLGAFLLLLSLALVIVALVVGNLRDVATMTLTAASTASVLATGWFSPRDAYF